jgi:hypothetical protein
MISSGLPFSDDQFRHYLHLPDQGSITPICDLINIQIVFDHNHGIALTTSL